MTRFLADESFRIDIVRGVMRRDPATDIVRAQEVNLSQTPDPIVLARAAEMCRVLLTHDNNDMPFYIAESFALVCQCRERYRFPGHCPWDRQLMNSCY